MPRESTPDTGIGQRIRHRRKLLKLTVRVADLAGIRHATFVPDRARRDRRRQPVHPRVHRPSAPLPRHRIRYAGNPAAACLVADRAQQAAEALDQPVMLGLAAFARSHAATGCGLYERALTIAEHAARVLEPHTDLPDAPEMLGQLYMTQAYALYALGRTDDAMEPVALAERIAADTGDSDALRLMFGPTNINFWRIAMEADGDSPGRAVEIARGTTPHAVDSISRQFAFYSDTGRALARTGRDAEALRMLLTADRLAPQRMRNPIIVETVRSLLERSRRGAGWTELRGLCERLGIG